MQIRYAGLITKNDFRKACFLHNQQLRRSKWIMGSILILVFISFLIVTIQNPSRITEFFPVAMIPLTFMTYPWWIPYLQGSAYNQQGNIYQNPIDGLIDETGITINGKALKASFLWQAYTRYSLTAEMILLYQGKNIFHIFTKTLFENEQEWNNFITLIKTKIANQ